MNETEETQPNDAVYRWVIGILAAILIALSGAWLGRSNADGEIRDLDARVTTLEANFEYIRGDLTTIRGDLKDQAGTLNEIRDRLPRKP